MRKIKSIPFCMIGIVPVLMLSACAGDKGVAVEPKPGLPAGSVVMLDPTVDDAMLPAIGEQMSKGAVTIYRLDGPQAPLPVDAGANSVMTPSPYFVPSPQTAPVQQRIQLTPPSGVNPNATPDPRVTVFGVDGNPVNGTMTTTTTTTTVTAAPLSPRIMPPPPPTTLNSPFAYDGTIAATPVPPGRAVMMAPIGADSVATPVKRPPKGMTY